MRTILTAQGNGFYGFAMVIIDKPLKDIDLTNVPSNVIAGVDYKMVEFTNQNGMDTTQVYLRDAPDDVQIPNPTVFQDTGNADEDLEALRTVLNSI